MPKMKHTDAMLLCRQKPVEVLGMFDQRLGYFFTLSNLRLFRGSLSCEKKNPLAPTAKNQMILTNISSDFKDTGKEPSFSTISTISQVKLSHKLSDVYITHN